MEKVRALKPGESMIITGNIFCLIMLNGSSFAVQALFGQKRERNERVLDHQGAMKYSHEGLWG